MAKRTSRKSTTTGSTTIRKSTAKTDTDAAPARVSRRAAKTTTAAPQTDITQEAIRYNAYLRFQERCRDGIPGDATSDWYDAERKLAAHDN